MIPSSGTDADTCSARCKFPNMLSDVRQQCYILLQMLWFSVEVGDLLIVTGL
jgi:hypothetical protein